MSSFPTKEGRPLRALRPIPVAILHLLLAANHEDLAAGIALYNAHQAKRHSGLRLTFTEESTK